MDTISFFYCHIHRASFACQHSITIDLDSKLLALIHLIQMKTGKWFIKAVMLVTIFVKFGGICSFDSGFRNKSMILTLEKSQVFGTILFFSFATIHVCRPIFSYAKKIEIQVLDWNTMCIWSRNMMKQRVFWEFIVLFIWNE